MMGEVRAAKRACVSLIERKGLSNITNSPAAATKILTEHPDPLPVSTEITKDYVDKLIQENRTLMKLIEERNKIIELSGAELQKLRIGYQKTQLQNWNLAQSNSQMLAELNIKREKMKSLQHELACKEALLKVKNLEIEGKLVDKNVVNHCAMKLEKKYVEEGKVEELRQKADDKQKLRGGNRKLHQRSQSMGVQSTNKQDSGKEKTENKRQCQRRQSARFVSQEKSETELMEKNFSEIEEAELPISQPLVSFEKEDKENSAPLRADHELMEAHRRRSSVGRPMRRAAEKVHSYKERPVNIKMRRLE
ncbi:hypothetical protein SAY87_025477 [Trapa incisa]|uniref:Shugoshin-1 n=1 Tax=Trapa incisa TaxID=236973 RepID=A0AAN7GHR1_9MYRT|nr:hypothetical protein SAY87_025477 [Trapa incisa]